MSDALTIFRGVCAGMAHAHHLNFIHRDLKPANVLLSMEGGHLIPKVADFGLVKALGDDAGSNYTRTGSVMGTPAYMAPEQFADSKTVDRRADIWSLGCLLYVMVTSQDPFHGDTPASLFHKIGTGEFTPPEELVPELPRRVVTAIRAMLTPDPAERVADCMDVVNFLDGRTETLKGVGEDLKELGPARSPVGMPGDRILPMKSVAGRRAMSASPNTAGVLVTTAATAVAVTEPEEGRGPWMAIIGVAVVLLVLFGGVGLGFAGLGWVMMDGSFFAAPNTPVPAPNTTVPAPVVPAPVASPVPVIPAPENVAPEPAPVGNPEPLLTPVAAPSPVEPTPSPAPAPLPVPDAEPVPVPSAQLKVEGAEKVELVASDGSRVQPGSVPLGSYLVLAWFDGKQVPAGQITIDKAGPVVLRCQAAMTRCSLR